MKNENNNLIKIVITGLDHTGKTILTNYLIGKELNFYFYLSTIVVDIIKKVLLYKENIYNLEIWDTSGASRYYEITKTYMKKSHIFFVFFNYNERRSFDFAKSIFDNRENEKQIFVLIGAKYDLKINKDTKDNIVHDEEVLEFAKEKNALCAHLSLLEKYSNGVNELFKKVFDEYIIRNKIQ